MRARFERGKVILAIAAVLAILPLLLYAQTERWVYRYTGPYNGWDRADAVVYGGDGNIYAAGQSDSSNGFGDFMVISLTSDGTERWRYRRNGYENDHDAATCIVYGDNGRVYAGGYLDQTIVQGKFFTIASFLPSGAVNWLYENYLLSNESAVNSIDFGQDGNVYAAGYGSPQSGLSDWLVASVADSGDFPEENWSLALNGSANSFDRASAIVCGADTNLYIAGTCRNAASNDDFTVLSLAPDSTYRWLYSYNGPANSADYGSSIVYGADNNIYAAGYSFNSSNEDIAVVSLDTAGGERWVYRYDGGGHEEARAIVYGADGNIYVAGYSEDSIDLDYDFMVISLTSAGAERWVYRYDGPDQDYDEAYSLVFGADGYIYAAGYSGGVGSNGDFVVICLSPAGGETWVYRYNGPGNSLDAAYSIDYGADGNLYAAGFSSNSGSSGAFTVISIASEAGVNEGSAETYGGAAITAIAPNPCDGKTTINLQLPKEAFVNLKIYDASGGFVRTLMAGKRSAGCYSISWDGRDFSGRALPGGVYFARLEAGGQSSGRQLILLR